MFNDTLLNSDEDSREVAPAAGKIVYNPSGN